MAAQRTRALRGVAGEVRAVGTGMGPVWVVLARGSWALIGLGCRCLGRLAGGIWTAVSLDPTREAEARAKAVAAVEARQKKRAAAKAAAAKKAPKAADLDEDLADEDEDDDPAEEESKVVLSAKAELAIRAAAARSLPESLALLGLGGGVATVGAAVLVRVAAGPAADWAGQVWESWAGLITTGVLAAWVTGALAAGPSLKEAAAIQAARRAAKKGRHQEVEDSAEQDDQDQGEDRDQEEAEEVEEEDRAEEELDAGTALLLHVLRALSDAEAARRAGVHLDVVLVTAAEAGLLPAGTEVGELRRWVESCGLPTKEIGMRIDGRTVTRVGVRVDAVTEVLGMAPGALLLARSEAAVRAPGETPAAAAPSTPVEAPEPAPVEAPAPAVLRLIPGGRQDPGQNPSPALPPTLSQGAR
ncbi:hypothetical protein [Streptomyces sp. Isolate_45]|uniref:hypothetical protein n=1 Tax=Streptomyces sp. Isolate_45 TaxID=2950111 RepID=UPI002481C4D9|nr:hypothetical protein [Streptomyces sp. Isolate_45]MDA5283678.1 hypothetical protein [Streptomyces sp. Isolate_45]